MDLLDKSTDENVERRVFRWYRGFVSSHNSLFDEHSFRTILCQQTGMCGRRDNHPIEGGHTPISRRRIKPSETVSSKEEEVHKYITCIFSDITDAKAKIENLWGIHRLRRPLLISALLHFQSGRVSKTNIEAAKKAYDNLCSHEQQIKFSFVMDGKSQVTEEEICQSTLELVQGWVEATFSIDNNICNVLNVSCVK